VDAALYERDSLKLRAVECQTVEPISLSMDRSATIKGYLTKAIGNNFPRKTV